MPDLNQKDHSITVSNLIAGLLKLKEVERKSVLFSLESGLSLDEVTNLEVRQANVAARNSKLAREIIKNCPVSIKTNYLFWESNEEKEHEKLKI